MSTEVPSLEQASNPEAGPQVPNFEQAPQPESHQQEIPQQPSPEIRLGKGNCWETLGLNENSSEAEVGQRFRSLAMKYHPDHGGNVEDFKNLMSAYDKAKQASLNGGGNGVVPEATMAASAGVAASGMADRGITPEQRQTAMDAMFAASNLASKEAEFFNPVSEAELNARHEARMREIDEDYARRKAEDASFSQHLDEMQKKIDAEIAAKKAQEKAEQEKMTRYMFSPDGPDEFVRDMQISAIKDIVMPLSESGLLSPQEINEFMAVGRVVQIGAKRSKNSHYKNV